MFMIFMNMVEIHLSHLSVVHNCSNTGVCRAECKKNENSFKLPAECKKNKNSFKSAIRRFLKIVR